MTNHFMNYDAWRHTLRGRFFQLVRNPDAAVDAYRAALASDPTHAPAAHRLAWLLASKGDLAGAEAALHHTVQAAPKNAVAWFNLGYICDQRGNATGALAAFREAVQLNPKLDRAWYGLGHCLVKSGNDTDAVPAFERVIQIDPMNWHAWIAMGLCFHRLGEKDKVRDVAMHLNRYQRRLARQLIHDTSRSDLEHLVADLEP